MIALALLLAAGPYEIMVPTLDGVRSALIVESDAPRPAPRPLVLVLHGHGSSAKHAISKSPLAQWAEIARREDIVIAALDGLRGSDRKQGWNDCRLDAPMLPRSDDVAYARAVVAKLIAQKKVDPSRIYAMGMSNGGMMSFRLALQMPELAAFCSVAASMAVNSSCPERPPPEVAALIIGGDADQLVPFAGGQVGSAKHSRGAVLSAAAVLEAWAHAHHHTEAGTTQTFEPHHSGDKTRARATFYGRTLAASDVALIHVEGGGHAEPTIAHRYGFFARRLTGAQSSAFESAELAWSFFRDKARPPKTR